MKIILNRLVHSRHARMKKATGFPIAYNHLERHDAANKGGRWGEHRQNTTPDRASSTDADPLSRAGVIGKVDPCRCPPLQSLQAFVMRLSQVEPM